MATKIKGGGARKYGRNKKTCEMYRNQQQRERNKAAKLARHLRRAPWDKVAREAFTALPISFQKANTVPPHSISPSEQRALDGTTLAEQERMARAA